MNLRANVTKTRAKYKFGGRSRKMDLTLFSPTNSPAKADVKRDTVFLSSKCFQFEKTIFASTVSKMATLKGCKVKT